MSMLYTIISGYDVYNSVLCACSASKFMDVAGGKIEYTMSGKNKVVKSLFSTDPAMYLDKRYQPGRLIKSSRMRRSTSM